MRDATNDYDFLALPGLSNSGVDHWQSYWCLAFRNASRVLQDEWDQPVLADWLARLDAAIAGGTRPAVLARIKP
jgi:predicted alpha/beta hydrolase family esterase